MSTEMADGVLLLERLYNSDQEKLSIASLGMYFCISHVQKTKLIPFCDFFFFFSLWKDPAHSHAGSVAELSPSGYTVWALASRLCWRTLFCDVVCCGGWSACCWCHSEAAFVTWLDVFFFSSVSVLNGWRSVRMSIIESITGSPLSSGPSFASFWLCLQVAQSQRGSLLLRTMCQLASTRSPSKSETTWRCESANYELVNSIHRHV